MKTNDKDIEGSHCPPPAVSGQIEQVVMGDLDLSTGKKVNDAFTNQIDLYSTNIDKFRSLAWFIDEAIKQAKSKSL
jgi:hypothetical protein